jgi:aryl-alcohol dehydrogenase-like predicted oxidoreductase
MTDITRREFVKVGAVGAAALAIGAGRSDGAPAMPERPLGKTGYKVRIFSLGGQAALETAGMHDESMAIINRAIDLGVNYIDTAAAYGRDRNVTPRWEANGISQTNVGEVMKTRRKEVFLASKTDDRTRDGALKQLEESLRSLQTDRVDLWQLHNITKVEELDQIFGKDGAIEAMKKARDEKMVRFLGITGHFDPAVLMKGIDRFPFDTVLMALNPADKHHLPFASTILAAANQKQMGVIGMKIPARDRLFKPDGITSMKGPMTYVLTLPVSTVIIGCKTVKQLEENVEIARAFTPMPSGEMAKLEAVTSTIVPEALWFRRDAAGYGKTTEDDQNMG